jgi:hypothetical protein
VYNLYLVKFLKWNPGRLDIYVLFMHIPRLTIFMFS